MSCFTEIGQWELRTDFQFDNKTWSHLHYKQFKVGSSNAEYLLTIGGFIGITINPFAISQPLNGPKFTTIDNDNDKHSGGNCASSYGGWWHEDCFDINPNRQPPNMLLNSKGCALLSIEMKIRLHDCISQ